MSSDRHEILAAVMGVPNEHLRRSYLRPLTELPQVRQKPTSWTSSPSGSFLLTLVLGFSVVTGVSAGFLTEVKLPIQVKVSVEPSKKDDGNWTPVKAEKVKPANNKAPKPE